MAQDLAEKERKRDEVLERLTRLSHAANDDSFDAVQFRELEEQYEALNAELENPGHRAPDQV